PRYRSKLATTRAGAVILGRGDRDAASMPRIVSDNPYAYYARTVALFHPQQAPAPGVHPTAQVHPEARVDPGAEVGPFAVVGAGARVARGAGRWIKIPQVGAVRIGDDVEIGANTTIDRGALDDTVIEDGVKLDNQI